MVLSIQNAEVGWFHPRVFAVWGIYLLLFAAYLYLAFAAVRKKSWMRMVCGIGINTVLLLLILQVGFLWGKSALTQQTPKEGEYIVIGKNLDQSKYSGKATISKNGDFYNLKWTINPSSKTPVQEYTSYGFLYDGYLCVHFSGSFSGIAVYRIAKDQLIGQWIGISGHNAVGQEQLLRGVEVLKPESSIVEETNPRDSRARSAFTH